MFATSCIPDTCMHYIPTANMCELHLHVNLYIVHIHYHYNIPSILFLVQPGQPRNLSYTILDDTSGLSLEWLPPTQPGVPAFTGYIVTLVKEDEMSNILVHSYTTDNKVLELADILSPGTTYNISVRATSVFFTDGGNESELVSFKQPTTG